MGLRCVCSKLAVAPFPLLLQLLVLSLMAQAAKPHDCRVEDCSHKYQHSMDENAISRGPHRRYCVVLRQYLECLRETARSCRGNLNYHTMSSLVVQWNNEFNCSYVVTTAGDPEPTKPPRLRPPPSRECSYNGRHEFRTCGLFGDPHLRTFNDKEQTCKVLGAWPLIDNAFLAVQVTNEAVVKGSKASATSKVTVIIKAHSPCAQEKTYEAQTDNLPATFVDGTQSSGHERSVKIRDREPGRHVEIVIKYIATTIVIRQVGHYLTFAIRMPRDVATQGVNREGLHLCLKGCPTTERIDHKKLLSHPSSLRDLVGSAPLAMPRELAVAQCKAINVTDFYFDSCVFDLMTTGDASFSQAANEAMLDGLALNPGAANSHPSAGGGALSDSLPDRTGPTAPTRANEAWDSSAAPPRILANNAAVQCMWCWLTLLCVLHFINR